MAIIEDIESFNRGRNALATTIKKKILGLSDNGSIQRLPGKPTCFIVNFTVLDKKNWSPEYNDFKHQHRLIATFFDRFEFNNAIDKIKEIIENGRLRIDVNTVYFHPQVRKQLKDLLYQNNN